MEQLNGEQRVARILQKVNTLYSILALVPACICWLITIDTFGNEGQNADVIQQDADVWFFRCSSILLFIFYSYTIGSPRIYNRDDYNKQGSLIFWFLVLLTNMLTQFLFIEYLGLESFTTFTFESYLLIIPSFPLVLSLIGIREYFKVHQLQIHSKVTQYGNK
jgi:hypothetical protein